MTFAVKKSYCKFTYVEKKFGWSQIKGQEAMEPNTPEWKKPRQRK